MLKAGSDFRRRLSGSGTTSLTSGFLVAALVASPALAQSSLPNPTLTPGSINPDVSQTNIKTTICDRGWLRKIRPSRLYIATLERKQIREYGYTDRRVRNYEEDHLIPLDLGGAPTDPQNLWPEPRYPADGWTAEMKTKLEAVLVRMVCSGELSLDGARQAITRDWHQAYREYVGQ